MICQDYMIFVHSRAEDSASLLNDELVLRQHRLGAFVLPATYWTMNASRARRAFLRSRTARVELFDSDRRRARR